VRDGLLVNTANYGANLMTVQRFQDFKLHAEFRLPGPGASGIFPRGRYWVMLRARQDTRLPARNTTGAVHKFLVPSENAGLGVGVWQSIDITMVGRRITVVVNGKTVIAEQIIPGITGSAIDSDEAAPGPIMLQGEETTVEFRNLSISVLALRVSGGDTGARQLSCAPNDSAAAAAVRARLAEWVRQANADDRHGMREAWAPGLVGWFPRAPLFSDSAAFAATGLRNVSTSAVRTMFDLVSDDIVASGSVVTVHDVWTETRLLSPGKKVQRQIRCSELWRCQPDGRWRIARYVSAPEPWSLER
jgi:ketosteroid isomerase-like protein